MGPPKVVSPEEWRAARIELLAEEKALTRARDRLNMKRRELPMVEIEKDYVFEGPEGRASLLDLFDGRNQLIMASWLICTPGTPATPWSRERRWRSSSAGMPRGAGHPLVLLGRR